MSHYTGVLGISHHIQAVTSRLMLEHFVCTAHPLLAYVCIDGPMKEPETWSDGPAMTGAETNNPAGEQRHSWGLRDPPIQSTSGEANCRKVRLQGISEVQLRVQIAGASEG
jgi:hypothetical protein